MTPAEMAAAVERANARLDAAPGFRLVCGGCGHTDTVPSDPEKRLYRCDECGARMAFGQLMPTIRILPDADRRFVVARFTWARKEVDVRLDRQYGADLAVELLSVCAPEAYQRLTAPTTDAPPATIDVATPATIGSPDSVEARLTEMNERGLCPCGNKATHANGFCGGCVARALAGG